MIIIYTTPSCSSCRKAKAWLEHYNIPYVEKNIFISTMDERELKKILMLTENGFNDIISVRSNVFKNSGVSIEDLTTSQVIKFIKEYPSILKRPIIVYSDKNRMQIGYNRDDIRIFLPQALRKFSFSCDDCPLKNDECRLCESDFKISKMALEIDRKLN